MTVTEKFLIQDGQYGFPYHWLPQLLPNGSFSTGRFLAWGLEYLTYMDLAAEKISRCSPRTILDVGCGDGRLKDFIASRSEAEYHGIDLSNKAIEFAKTFNPNARFDCIDIAELNAKYDVVSMVEVLEHIPDGELGKFLSDASDLLSDSGRLIISVPTVNRPKNKKHFRHYTLEMVNEQLDGAGFEIVESEYSYRIGFISKSLEKLSVNGFYSLNPSIISKALWSIHRRVAYRAGERNGAHLIVSAKLKGRLGRTRIPK